MRRIQLWRVNETKMNYVVTTRQQVEQGRNPLYVLPLDVYKELVFIRLV